MGTKSHFRNPAYVYFVQAIVMYSGEERQQAMIAHIGSLIVSLFSGCGWVVALVIYLMNKDKSKFASYHALQSLYFQGFIFLLAVVSGILMCVGIGFLLLPVVFIANIVLPIMVGIEANKGSLSEYPIVGAMAKQTIGI